MHELRLRIANHNLPGPGEREGPRHLLKLDNDPWLFIAR